jgi:hypothetical protein
MDARNRLQPFPGVRGQFVKPFDLFKPVQRHGGIIEKKMAGSSRKGGGSLQIPAWAGTGSGGCPVQGCEGNGTRAARMICIQV